MAIRKQVTIEGNEAAAYIAFKTNEVIAIYPITPSTPIGELADTWAAKGQKNIWGTIPLIQEMQSEGGAAGACHGALQTGALTTTFTASQGLLLMIPNMYKIAGELTSAVFHVTARSLAASALSIFGDHSDVMACRATGWGVMFSNSVQEVHDFALISQASTLRTRVPFIHAFDGFRTSHEVAKIEQLTEEDIRAMIDEELVTAHRLRGLSPDRPVLRGTAQNPDVYFQAREAVNPYYLAAPEMIQQEMDKFASITGRSYHLFDYVGAPDAERVVVIMGSGADVVDATAESLIKKGEKIGVLKVRVFRPFSTKHLLSALPATVKSIAVLDRTKEPGSAGEPLYQDVVTAISEGLSDGTAPFKNLPRIIGGRYGLSCKDFTPAMVKAVFDEMSKPKPKVHFTIGINDDVTNFSLDYDEKFSIEPEEVVRGIFWGLGSDGTVGANRNSIKIIGEDTPNFAQGYFVFDSKKSGGITTSHLRFGPNPIKGSYLIQQSNFVACHQSGFLERYAVLDSLVEGGTFLLNSLFSAEEVWDQLPRIVQEQLIAKKVKFFVIDAYDVAKKTKMGVRINTIMQVCFFALSNVIPVDEAISHIKAAIQKTYGKRGEAVVQQNCDAVDQSLAHLQEVKVPTTVTSTFELPPVVPAGAPDYVKNVLGEMIAMRGEGLPVSMLSADGTFPTATTQWEKRNIAQDAPVWESDLCIQCGKCVLVCPHAVIRSKVYDPKLLDASPEMFKSTDAKWKELPGQKFTIQISVEDCTGCAVCVEVCPGKDKTNIGRKALNMTPQLPIRNTESKNWEFFLDLPETSRTSDVKFNSIKNVQLLRPLFEFSGACAGCGETPYVKLLSQLFGERSVIANATGCSSIYGGNLPTTPWAKNKEGRGPAWSNSLFEDNAEFGLGFRLTINQQVAYARNLVADLTEIIGADLTVALLDTDQSNEVGIEAQRANVETLKMKLVKFNEPKAKTLMSLADVLVKKNVWIMGGDGWAYDIGYGGLDHVLSTGHNVNLLVLDTEVYSNTGGQASKSTQRGAVAKFAAAGKPAPKKDLGRMAMAYGNVYVAQIAMGANDAQTVKAFIEAESYEGPSLIIAYSHCIAHGIDMTKGLNQQKMAVDSGYWPMYRFDPRLADAGKNPFQLDSREPTLPLKDYIYSENRFRMLIQSDPGGAEKLLHEAEKDVIRRWRLYKHMSTFYAEDAETTGNGSAPVNVGAKAGAE
ncbi:MAG: pyruvate:ferredoxin (flavodoxin) oxidoreductase [bacterium]